MIKLAGIYAEMSSRSRTLHVYDFDDTLVKTNTTIKIIKSDGTTQELTSREYVNYMPKPGDKLDFSNFDKLINSSKPIITNIGNIRKSINTPNIKTTILTARKLAFPIMYHLRKKYKINAYVVAVGGSNPELKADWIEKQVVNSGYNNIVFTDDSEHNLDAVRRRLEKYPHVELSTNLVK